MKKKFVMLLVVAVVLSGVIGSISCSNEEEMPVAEQVMPNSEAAALAALQQDIMKLNQARATKMEPQMRAGIFRKFIRYIKRVVFADALGALFGSTIGSAPGALIGGVASSAVAAIPSVNRNITFTPIGLCSHDTPAPFPGLFNDPEGATGGLVLGDPSSLTLADSIGYYHNVALLKLNEEHPEWLQFTGQVLISKLVSQVEDVAGLNHGRLLSDTLNDNTEFMAFNENVVAYYDATEEYEEYVALFKQNYPELADEIAVVEEFINGFDNIEVNTEDQVQFATDVLNLINTSEQLSDETKHALRSGVLVGNASAKLWNPEAFEE